MNPIHDTDYGNNLALYRRSAKGEWEQIGFAFHSDDRTWRLVVELTIRSTDHLELRRVPKRA